MGKDLSHILRECANWKRVRDNSEWRRKVVREQDTLITMLERSDKKASPPHKDRMDSFLNEDDEPLVLDTTNEEMR